MLNTLRRAAPTVVGFAAMVLLAFVAAVAHAQDASIRVGGPTTAPPIISSCAAHFMEKHTN